MYRRERDYYYLAALAREHDRAKAAARRDGRKFNPNPKDDPVIERMLEKGDQ